LFLRKNRETVVRLFVFLSKRTKNEIMGHADWIN
jgi:ribosomal protein S17E